MKRLVPILAVGLLVALMALGPAQAQGVQKLTITMREYKYTPNRVTLQVGVPAEITLINKGKLKHEFMLYDRMPMGSMTMGHEWVEGHNYFHGMMVNVEGAKVTRKGADVFEVTVGAGQAAVVKFTPTRKGTFEFGCMIKGHYEKGQVGLLTVK